MLRFFKYIILFSYFVALYLNTQINTTDRNQFRIYECSIQKWGVGPYFFFSIKFCISTVSDSNKIFIEWICCSSSVLLRFTVLDCAISMDSDSAKCPKPEKSLFRMLAPKFLGPVRPDSYHTRNWVFRGNLLQRDIMAVSVEKNHTSQVD